MKFLNLFRVLYKHRSLLNVSTWKNVQMVSVALSAIAFTVLHFFPSLSIDSQVIEGIVTGIAYIGSAIAIYLTPATTNKIGLPNDKEIDNNNFGEPGELHTDTNEELSMFNTPVSDTQKNRGLHNGW